MTSELDNRCPICLDSWEEASYVMPCLHQFCHPCILRWAESKPECPLCKKSIASIVHSVQADDDFEEHVLTPPAASMVIGHQTGRAPGCPAAPSPAEAQPQPAGMAPRAPVGSLWPSAWASLFQDHPALLQPLLSWVRQELGRLFLDWRSWAALVEELPRPMLVLFGLDEDLLVQLLEATLENRAVTFVHQLIEVAMEQCSREAHRLLGLEDSHAAGAWGVNPRAAAGSAAHQGGSPAAGLALSSSPERSSVGNLAGPSGAALQGGPSSLPSARVPVCGEREEPQEEPEEAMAPPSTSSQGRERSPGRLWRPPKRRTSRPQTSPLTKKRPPRWQR